MTKLLIAVAAVLFSALNSFAQQNPQPGYIVNNNGDTLKGTVNNLLWRESPKEVSFTGPDGTNQYGPEEILAFGAGQHTFYRSFRVKIDTTGGTGGDKAKAPNPTFLEKHVFLQVIVDSKVSLLKYRSGFGTHFFIEQKGSVPEELISHSSSLLIAGRTLDQPGNQFIAQLKDKLGDCPSLKIDTGMKYMESTLTEVFQNYSQCKSDKVVTPGNEPKKVYFGVVAAAHYDMFEGFDNGIGFSGGGFLEIVYPKGVYKTSWYTEAVYYKYGEQKSSPYKFDIAMLKITTLAKTRFIESKTQPYILGGVSRAITSLGSTVYVNNKELAGKMKGHWSLVLGTGMFITKSLSAELRAEYTTPISYSNRDLVLAGGVSGYAGLGPRYAVLVGLNFAYRIALPKK